MRLPSEMRQLSGTAEFLAVEIAARHSRVGEELHVVTDCLTVVQSWKASVWRRDDYRNLAGGFWRLMGGRSPHLISEPILARARRSRSACARNGEEAMR